MFFNIHFNCVGIFRISSLFFCSSLKLQSFSLLDFLLLFILIHKKTPYDISQFWVDLQTKIASEVHKWSHLKQNHMNIHQT